MSRKSKKLSRALSWLMSLAMVLSLMPTAAFAAEPARIEDNDESVVWSENNWKVWQNEVHFRETAYNATEEDAFDTVTVPFTGTGIQVIGKKASNGNIMTAVMDDGKPVDVDFYGNQGLGGEQLVYEVKGLASGEHTLVLTNTNRHNEAAQPLPDAKGNFQPEINYFIVLDEPAVDPEPEPEPELNFADGVNDAWTVDNNKDGVICAVENGWLHLKSVAANGNNPGTAPAMFVNPNTFDFSQPGFFEFTLKSNNDNSAQAGSDRFGVFVGYSTATGKETGMFLGYDNGGWFWQKYNGDPNDPWYGGGRRPAPAKGAEVQVRIDWTADKKATLSLDGTAVFTDEDFSGIVNLGDKIALKGGSWNDKAQTDVLLKDIHYTGQAAVKAYAVSGSVVDEKGEPVANAKVELNGKTVMTDEAGAFVFDGENGIIDGEHTAFVSKEGCATIEVPVTVSGADVALAEAVVLVELPGVSGVVADAEGNPIANAVVTVSKLVQQIVNNKPAMVTKVVGTGITDAQGQYQAKGIPDGEYDIVAAADFYYSIEKQTVTVANGAEKNFTLAPLATATLTTPEMDVTISTDFPLALKYDMKGELEGKTMLGQTRLVKNIYINNAIWATIGEVTSTAVGENAMTYDIPVTAKNDKYDVEAVIHVELKAEGNVLTFTITGVDYPRDDRLANPVEQIYFFDQSLISVQSNQPGAKIATATMAPSTIASGDTFDVVDDKFDVKTYNGRPTRYIFLATDELSAGVFSNSDIGNGGAGSDNNRGITTAVDRTLYKKVGGGSNQWYYDRKISSVDPANAKDVDRFLNDDQKVIGIREGRDEQPYVRVVITGEQNNDGVMDWQDAAIVARDQEVVHIPVHSDKVPEVVTTRIAMNFESEAPNPFLTTLDNVKRVALHSDGLGQSVLLKGYASEGHDSGHPDYYDIGERMGGVDDFKTMLTEGHKLGAQFGIHTNASEFYPEADAFNDEAVRWDGTRFNAAPQVHYGWNWLDQGIAMNGVYDLATDNRYTRYNMLHQLVGDNTNGGDGLDYIYVDVWGNFTSGSENAWHTRKLSNDITAGDNNWRIVHEWAWANDWDSTFQHWVSDFPYGNYADKGKQNSSIIRFMLNSHKDSWVPDFPSYGGAANAPLLGGPAMQGFEGWQSDYEYDLFIDTLYNEMLPTKFLQHYDAMKWVTDTKTVALPYGAGSGDFSWNNTSNWKPDVQITLRGQDDPADEVVVTRGSDAEINASYAYGNKAERLEYRSRYITLNGKPILIGASNPGDFHIDRSVQGDLRYLIPWYWDAQGNVVSAEAEKLYHYNIKGGETTWTLPDGWETLENVTVYKLTGLGRTEETSVAVVNGTVTLTAEAEIPYVVVKGAEAKAPVVDWTANGQHLRDVSFNSSLEDNWTVEGQAKITSTEHDVPMLQLTGKSSVRQQLTDLKAGVKYAVYVGVDNRSDAKAMLQILDSQGNVVASQYTLRSFVPNVVGSYIHQSKWYIPSYSYFQNMYVFFTPVEGETYTVVLSREEGAGFARFDDVRVAERGILNVQKPDPKVGAPGLVEIKDHYTYDEQGNFVKYEQDFEHVAQGLYPFVAYNGGQITDCRMHLAKLHAPYTQAGWDTKMADDVLGGNWSIKINGQSGRNSLMYTTIPQNFHFEPGQQYIVEFDYQMGSDGTYEAVVLDGGVERSNVTASTKLYKSLGKTAHAVMVVTGAESGQTGVGIWSTGKGAQVPAGAHADFGGYKDFMLDNLVIRPLNDAEVVLVDISTTLLNRGETADITVTSTTETGSVAGWESSEPTVAYVEGDKVLAVGAGTAVLTATTSAGDTRSFEITVIGESSMNVTGRATANTEERGGEGSVSGYARAASDGRSDTYWHSQWSGGSFNVSASNPAVLTVDFGTPQNMDKFFIQQRPSGPNGVVKAFTYVLKGADGEVLKTGDVAVPKDGQKNGAITTVTVNTEGVRYLQIRVTNGYGGFASLAEVGIPAHAVFTDKASLNDVTVGTNEHFLVVPVTAPGEKVMGAVWTIADPQIATVDAEGVVTGLKVGETTITLSNAFGELATAKLTVTLSERDQQMAATADGLISAIGEVTLDSADAIASARRYYDNLPDTAKALVENLAVLEAAEAKLAELRADSAAAAEVDELIDAIGRVTLKSEEAINAARTAYDALTDAQKALVANIEALTAAEAKLAELKQAEIDKTAAAEVDALIDAIGDVTLSSEPAIKEARTAYDALTEVQQNLVKGLEVLMNAEAKLDELKNMVKVDSVKVSADRFLNEQKFISFKLSLDKPQNLVAVEVSYEIDALGAKLTACNGFALLNNDQKQVDDKLVGNVTLVYTGADKKLTSDELVGLLRIEVNGANNVKPTLVVTDMVLAGRDSTDKEVFGSIINGIDPDELTYRLAYDINNDGEVNLLDVVAAQKWYQTTENDDVWPDAEFSDVNMDGVVDVQDYILIILNYTNFPR